MSKTDELKSEDPLELSVPLINGATIVDTRFNRFDEEVIDKYFNEEGKRAIERYIEAHTNKAVIEGKIEELDKLTDWLDERDEDAPFHAGMVYDYERGRTQQLKDTHTQGDNT